MNSHSIQILVQSLIDTGQLWITVAAIVILVYIFTLFYTTLRECMLGDSDKCWIILISLLIVLLSINANIKL